MFAVTWLIPVLDRLSDRPRMAAGVEAPNRRLALRPWDEGESREEDLRITVIPLLVVRFQVDRMADTVQVTTVDRFITVDRYGR